MSNDLIAHTEAALKSDCPDSALAVFVPPLLAALKTAQAENERLQTELRKARGWKFGRRALTIAAAAGAGLVLAFGGAGVAHADMRCTTSYSGDISYTLCRYLNPWQPATMTQCNRYGCMTRQD